MRAEYCRIEEQRKRISTLIQCTGKKTHIHVSLMGAASTVHWVSEASPLQEMQCTVCMCSI